MKDERKSKMKYCTNCCAVYFGKTADYCPVCKERGCIEPIPQPTACYTPPAITAELDLETKAGSPQPKDIDTLGLELP